MTTMTRETSIRCGKCKGRHSSVAEIKACYRQARRDPFDGIPNADDSENFNRSWAAMKNEFAQRERQQEEAAFRSDPDFRTYAERQSFSNSRAPSSLPSIPAGHYAVKSLTGNNDLDFFRVDEGKGRWAGRTFVVRVIGGRPGVAVRGITAHRALKAIEEAEPKVAAKQYADEIGRCHHCNRHLTDELSRERGSGPDCFAQHGW